MRRSNLLAVLVAGLLLIGAAGPAAAQGSLNLSADIPFEFVVGNTTLPAGKYTVDNRPHPTMVLVQSEDARNTAIVLTNAVQSKGTLEEGKLVFNRYGDRYFLSQVWKPGNNTGFQIPKHRRERELAQRAALFERVIVLAKR